MSLQFQYYNTVTHGYTGILTANSAVLITDGSGVPSFSAALPAITGTTTNDDAAVGKIGEYVNTSGSNIALTNVTVTQVTNISLTAGDWDVQGLVEYLGAATTFVQNIISCVHNADAPAFCASGTSGRVDAFPDKTFLGGRHSHNTGLRRFSLATTTTIYLLGYCSFGTSTCTVSGQLTARRIR